MDKNELFRKEAMEARAEARGFDGSVVLYMPRSYWALVGGITFIAACIIVLLVFGSYTRRVTVSGELLSDQGVIPVFLPRPGIVSRYLIAEGERVQVNDSMLEVSNEIFGASNRSGSIEIAALLNRKKETVQRQLAAGDKSIGKNIENIERKISSIVRERLILSAQSAETKAKNELAKEMLSRHNGAKEIGAVSEDELAAKKIALLESSIGRSEKERELELLERNLKELLFQKVFLQTESATEKAKLERELIGVEEQLLEADSQRGVIVKAPITGVITAIQGSIGSLFENTKPIALIIPEKSKIEAQVLVPSSSIGFLKKGQVVFLRYAAYPYQQFGQGRGEIYSISNASLAPNEIAFGSRMTLVEPMYIVKIKITEQEIKLNGSSHFLKPGIKVDADIMLEEQKLYQWILRPFFAAAEKLK
ncbi:HlyD family secretion protein [Variovorax sp. ZS18.2.2]|uniref:HlyD family secretion protein n=1 Tax=Variovorax sp. ZS18.2.2 TaxID=2971255 RepID=UPI00215162BD|nr:HlyD family secretion protein [Variovorax sp. ZS18.2.2]MCR6476505.1 HlyD family secretion protein [Variovorax sp. ZS18.2.2]